MGSYGNKYLSGLGLAALDGTEDAADAGSIIADSQDFFNDHLPSTRDDDGNSLAPQFIGGIEDPGDEEE